MTTPFGALDLLTRERAQADLQRIRLELGTTVVLITHDLAEATSLADRVAVMYAGEILEEGPTAEIFADPRHPYTRRLLSCVPILGRPERALDAIPGLPPAVNRLPRGCHFADRCDRVIDRCRAADVELDPLGPGRTSRCIRAREA